MFLIQEKKIPLTEIFDNVIHKKNSRLFILREDLIHPEISGNKWRKLKYNVREAKRLEFDTVLTFGGAYSNHIAATAAAGKYVGLKTIGIIRGEETLPLNPTLQLAKDNGMVLKYISREDYKDKDNQDFIVRLKNEFGEFYHVPEGGTNLFAVKGCAEILDNVNVDFDLIACACGTGGTIAGIISSTKKQVLGFPALKGASFLNQEISKLLSDYNNHFAIKTNNKNWELNLNYHFGGYAKIKPELIDFIQQFKQNHKVELDLIYTGKMMYGIYDLLNTTNQLNNKTIIVVHTGGVQGNKGFEERFGISL